MRLNELQLDEFQRNGYLVIPDFVSASDRASLRQRADELVAEFDPRSTVSIFSTIEQTRTSDEYFLDSGDKIRFFFEADAFDSAGTLRQVKEKSINKIGHALHVLDPVFAEFSQSDRMYELAASLNSKRPTLVQSMYIFKQPHIGGEVTCHQDSTFLYTNPPSVVGLWFALETATVDNGCLWALPGGHSAGLRSRFVRDGNGGTKFQRLDPAPWPETGIVPLEVAAGTLILLDGMLPHLSRANRSDRSRHAYSLHFIDGDCEFPAENWLRPAKLTDR
ncbi:MAG: phytanoyl-CoA dioxygenase family protein [Pyrinomonadaceae bacterium]